MVMPMRAVNNNNNMRDDSYFDRLFSYFQSQFKEEIIKFRPLRKNVIYVKTNTQTLIVKGYQTNQRLKLQEAFTATLRKEGFLNTYNFIVPPVHAELFFEGTYFGCIEYIPPSKTVFSYHSQSNRQEGLDLLEQFHQSTAGFEARYRTLIPRGDINGKWVGRFQQFSKNLPYLRHYMAEYNTQEILSWGQWSLSKLNNTLNFDNEHQVILHGDVAHHNFLRNREGQLYLIDFDLINIGPPAYDFLQYANRILPYLDWSMDKLFSHKQLKKYKNDQTFLSALVYPADIYREWNRIIRGNLYRDQRKLNSVIDLSIGQFHNRKKFIEKVKDMLE
jgi:thiamine kinase-like enzyme